MKTKKIMYLLIPIVCVGALYGCGFRLTSSGNTICSNYSEPMSTLRVDLIHDMTSKYKQNQYADINDGTISQFGPNLLDARSIWFDFETLKRFVYHLENETKKGDPSITTAQLGVRIYYSSYPEATQWSRYGTDLIKNGTSVVPTNFEGHHTLVVVPTIRNDSINADFNPLDTETYYEDHMNNSDKYRSRSSDRTAAMPLNVPESGGPSSSPSSTGAQNHGSLIPPRNPTSSETNF